MGSAMLVLISQDRRRKFATHHRDACYNFAFCLGGSSRKGLGDRGRNPESSASRQRRTCRAAFENSKLPYRLVGVCETESFSKSEADAAQHMRLNADRKKQCNTTYLEVGSY
jgi:hypothetical protein